MQLDQAIDGDGRSVAHNEGVHVDRSNVGAVDGELSEANEQSGQLFSVNGWFSAKGAEEGLTAQVFNQCKRIIAAEGSGSEGHVVDGFGKYAANAHHHARTELGVTDNASNKFADTADLLGDKYVNSAVFGSCFVKEFGGCRNN